jgi:hypothetical protein
MEKVDNAGESVVKKLSSHRLPSSLRGNLLCRVILRGSFSDDED